MGALVCTAPLLLLLHSLLFAINACNECGTRPGVVILNNDGFTISSTHQLPPCSCLRHMKEDKNIVSCCFVFHVQRIYYELMFRLPCDMCTVKMTSSCKFFLVFPHTIFYLVCAFPSCYYWCIIFCGSFVSVKLSSFSPIFLSFLVSPFLNLPSFLHHFMVDFSLVRTSCPSISFFLAHQCGLLQSVGRKCPGVGLFVRRDCPYRFVLPFLFPLVYRSVRVAQTSIMSGEEIRSSELEMGLSLFED